jgi:hypothetical protein
LALDDLVDRVSHYGSSVLGREGPIQETGRMALGGLAGAALPIVLGACGTLAPQAAMSPLTWFYSGGLGFTATGVYQLDSLAGKMAMTIPAVGYFLPKTITALSYGMSASFPYASGVMASISTGISSATGYVASAFSYASAYVGAALPYIGIGVAAAGIVYAGYRIVKGWYNKLKRRRTYNGARNRKAEKLQSKQK